jgi:hypothetical protein
MSPAPSGSPVNTPTVNDVSAHLIRRSVNVDPNHEGSLGIIHLALAGAYQARRSHSPGTREAAEWTLLIDHLEDLWKQARSAADARFDPSGL